MQKHAEIKPSTMAAVLGLADNVVEKCASIDGIVVATNYNCPGQLISRKPLQLKACEAMKAAGRNESLHL
jgi:[acyl-carrier-protein] S-malonyltransferase